MSRQSASQFPPYLNDQMAKYPRNQPCWCGSGKKYKKCHLNRETQTPIRQHEAIRGFGGVFDEARCLHHEAPNGCSSQFVRAHTISKRGALSAIAEDGHVVAYPNLHDVFRLKGRPTFVRRGVNQATTFVGFCSHHDDSTFKLIDTTPFDGSSKYCGLLAYRETCRELFHKESIPAVVQHAREFDKGRSEVGQHKLQLELKMAEAMSAIGARDLRRQYDLISQCVDQDKFSNCKGLVFRFDAPSPLLCSSCFSLSHDIHGDMLFDLTKNFDTPVPSAWLEILPDTCGTFAFLMWHKDDETIQPVVAKQLLEEDPTRIPSLLMFLAVACSDNVVIRPSWWESLASDHRAAFEAAMGENTTDLALNPNIAKYANDNPVWSSSVTASRL